MLWSRGQYLELQIFGKVERPMFTELFGPLIGLEEEWRAQGATDEEIDLTAFEFDYVRVVGCGANTGLLGGYTPCIVEDTPAYQVTRDALGRTMKRMKDVATIALPLDYPVTDMDSWLKIKPFYTYHKSRVNWDHVEAARRAQEDGALVVAGIPGGFDLPRQLMGEENACLCYYDQPELMHDILTTVGTTALRVLEQVSDRITIDQLSVHEDMAGKSGSLVGGKQIIEFIKPYYRTVWDLLASRGTKIFSQDSDGNMNAVIDAFLECGLTEMYPMEPAAGMDIVHTRNTYGNRLTFRGGIDKHVLRASKAEIREELEYKLQLPSLSSGVVFGLDHRIPNGTPLENYRYYVDTAREILGLPARAGLYKGWARMAF